MKSKSFLNNLHGFTLVELMVVVLLTGIAVIAIYRGYTAFSHSADVQEQIIEMQQNLRIGMYWIEKDLRRAGMNEEDDDSAGFEAAEDSLVNFTMDLWGDDQTDPEDEDELDDLDGTDDDIIEDIEGDGSVEDSGEKIRYTLNAPNLQKQVWDASIPGYSAWLTIITNVDALNFVYLDENGDDLDPDATPDDPASGRTALDTDGMAEIRSVEVAMVVRTTNEDYRYTNNEEYRNAQESLIYKAPGDNFRRRLYIKRIKIRNAGL